MEQTDMSFRAEMTPDGFWSIEQNGVRCFLLEGMDEALLVDSCFGGELAELCRLHASHPVQLLLTHSDPDHTGCVEQFNCSEILRAVTLSAPSLRTISKAVSTIISFVIFAFGGIIISFI